MSTVAPEILVRQDGKSQREMWDALFVASRYDLFTFAYWFLDMRLLIPRVHGALCNFVERPVLEYCGVVKTDVEKFGDDWAGDNMALYPRETQSRKENRDQLILLPRSSYKTSILAIALPTWLLALFPDWSIAVAGKSDDMSTATLSAIEQHMSGNQLLNRYFPQLKRAENSRWTLHEKFIAGRSKLGERAPSLWATSVGSFKPSYHFNAIIIDDPIDGKTVLSDDLIKQADSFFSSITPVLDIPRLRWVIGTRWGMVDLYAKIMDMKVKARTGQDSPMFDRYIRAVYNPDGSLWFPEKFDESEIEKIKAGCASRYIFSSQYLMKPVAQDEQTLATEAIGWFDEGDWPQRSDMTIALGVDPADPRGDGGDWAIWVVGADAHQHYWDLEHVKAPTSANKAASLVRDLARRWTPNYIIVEDTVISRGFIDSTLKNMLDTANIRTPITKVSHGGHNKLSRIAEISNSIGSVMERGALHLRRKNYAVQTEIEQFPSRDVTYDLLDIGSYITQFIGGKRLFPRAPEPVKKEQDPFFASYWEELDQTLARAARDSRPDSGLRRAADRYRRYLEPMVEAS